MAYADPEVGRQRRREQARRRRVEHSELVRQQRRESARRRRALDPWRGKTPEEFRHEARKHASARRARLRAAFIEHVEPSLVYGMHGGMCGICKEFIEGEFHVDHVKPLSCGGMHGYVNVQPAHPLCNLRKNAREDYTHANL